MLETEREAVAAAGRRLAAEGLVVGPAGNASVRADDLVAITPTGAALGDLAAEDVCVVDLDGNRVAGEREPTTEIDIHLGVLRHRDAGGVVHTHSPMATALSCVIDELPFVHYTMQALGGTVRVAPYERFGTPALAAGVLGALEGRRAALMANHGAVVLGADADDAVESALLLEWACTVFWRASALGEPRLLDEEQRRAVADSGYPGLGDRSGRS